jgi:hypothetical protein
VHLPRCPNSPVEQHPVEVACEPSASNGSSPQLGRPRSPGLRPARAGRPRAAKMSSSFADRAAQRMVARDLQLEA